MKTRREAALERRRKKKELINTETINREDNSKTKKGKALNNGRDAGLEITKQGAEKLQIIPIRPEEGARRKDLRELHPNLPDVYSGQLIALVAP